MESLTTGAVVGIAVVTTAVVIFVAGTLVGILLFYCINKHQSHSSKPDPSSHQQQQAVSSSTPLQQTGPVYEEVPTANEKEKIELKKNMAYGPVQH